MRWARWTSFVVGLLSTLLVAEASAHAGQTDSKGNTKSGAGPTPGGSTAGGSSALGGSSDTGVIGETERDQGAKMTHEGEQHPKKSWMVEASYEFHRLVRQSDLGGDGVNRNFNYFLLGGSYDLTEYDRISARVGLYERFLADSGETGVRLDDAVVGYTRLFKLPDEFRLRAQVRTVIPLSFESKLQGLITAPRVALFLERKFGIVDTLLLGYVEGYVSRYKEAQGGNANPTMRVAALAEVDVTMPFHKALMIGADLYTASTWFYETQGLPPSGAGSYYGSSPDPGFTSGQPVSQVYGGEVCVRYHFPEVSGFLVDAQLAYANGDPVLGYQSSLHDGVFRFNGFYRHVAEVYFALNAHY